MSRGQRVAPALNATVLHCLDVAHERLTFRSQGRDFRLTNVEGRVVKGLLRQAGIKRYAQVSVFNETHWTSLKMTECFEPRLSYQTTTLSLTPLFLPI